MTISYKKVEIALQKRLYFIPLILIVLSIALIVRLKFASIAQYPGHADYAFYYTVAENIVDGRGMQIDYIWNYLGNPESITHSSNDYWMPLTSIIISLSQFILGKTLFAALLPSIFAGLLLSVITFFLSKIYSDSQIVALCSSGLILFMPPLFEYSLLTDSAIYYALFVSVSLFFMVKGWRNPKLFLVSSASAGLAHLTRQDGVLLIPVLLGVILLSRQPIRIKIVYISLTLGVYFLLLSPLMIANYRTFGTPFSPGPFKTIFLTTFEDLYSYSKELSLHSYLEWGLSNIVLSKLQTAVWNLRRLYTFLGSFLSIFAVVAILRFTTSQDERQRWMIYLPPSLFLVVLFVFYSFIATVPSNPGGFLRSGMAIIPFLVVISVDAVDKTIPSRSTVLLSVLLILSLFFIQSVRSTKNTIGLNTQMGERLAALKEILTTDAREQGYENIVIMTRNPWEVCYSTRYKAIQIPNESIEIICQVARKFGANYLLLPAPREALEPIFQGELQNDMFQLVAEISNMKLFRMRFEK